MERQMTQADANVELVARVRDFIYECTSDEFSTGWAPSTHQAEDLIRLVVEPTLHPLPSELIAKAEAAVHLIAEGNFYNDYDQSTEALGDLRNLLTAMQRSTPTAPVQGDDAEWLRELARTADEVEAPRFERIASRLSGDNNAALVEALKPFAVAAHLLTSNVHNGGLENVQAFPTPDEWRLAGSLFPEYHSAVRRTALELRASITSTDADGGRR